MVAKKKNLKTKTNPKNKATKKNRIVSSFPIVGIGASAGGLSAFEMLFSQLPKIGMAYVVITHLDRDHTSILADLIKKHTVLTTVSIRNGMVVKPDTIYVIPPKKNIAIKHGVLMFVEQEEPHYKNLPINFFFHSLAEDQGENAIAIILSGSGFDGSLGLRDIKEQGGLTIAQDPTTANFDSMPQSAINTGLIDYVMPPEEMPTQLMKYLKYGKIKEGQITPELQQIFILLRTHTGHDFSHYKLNTVCRRIEKQMYLHHIATLADYIRFLRLNPHEVGSLFKDLLIGVTRFFRDTEAFDLLTRKIIPAYLKKKPANYDIRIWIPGCATGEEAYSMAIILRECMDEMKKYFNIQVFGTDIDTDALDIARSGIYPLSIENDVSDARLKKFFIKDQNHYKVKKEIRSMVIFGEQNIIKDPPFTKLDIICCRNLLIYLNTHLQKRLLPLFHYSLKPKGLLFLGTSEATLGFTDHFQLIAKKWKIFERKDAISAAHALFDMNSVTRMYDVHTFPVLEQKNIDLKLDFLHAIKTFLLSNYVPPAIVVNKKGDVLYTHGDTRNYLRNSKKKNNLTISDDIFTEIKMVLIPAIRRASLQKKEIICQKIEIANKSTTVDLHVKPITHIDLLQDLLLVVFVEKTKQKPVESITRNSVLQKTNKKLEEVVQELQYTKENLKATIEELEAGNEELQSTNEELQSTNEEIETSKEELQSLNEELIISNSELQSTIDQLATVNDDMNNLFNSTEIAAFFLDNNLHIKRFTPKAQEFIHLIKTDIGRSITHFATTMKYENLVEDAKEVLKTLHQKNLEVESEDNRWYHIRILPYRTLTNVIDGVVITLSEITLFKEYENKLTQLNDELQDTLAYVKNIINTLREPFLVLSADLKIIFANLSFYKTFKIGETDTIGKHLFKLKGYQWDIADLKELLDNVISKDEFFENFKIKITIPEIGETNFILNARKVYHQKSKTDMILLAMEFV